MNIDRVFRMSKCYMTMLLHFGKYTVKFLADLIFVKFDLYHLQFNRTCQKLRTNRNYFFSYAVKCNVPSPINGNIIKSRSSCYILSLFLRIADNLHSVTSIQLQLVQKLIFSDRFKSYKNNSLFFFVSSFVIPKPSRDNLLRQTSEMFQLYPIFKVWNFFNITIIILQNTFLLWIYKSPVVVLSCSLFMVFLFVKYRSYPGKIR